MNSGEWENFDKIWIGKDGKRTRVTGMVRQGKLELTEDNLKDAIAAMTLNRLRFSEHLMLMGVDPELVVKAQDAAAADAPIFGILDPVYIRKQGGRWIPPKITPASEGDV